MPPKAKYISGQNFLAQFNHHRLGHLYCIYGPEEYLKEKIYNALINRAIKPEAKDFDLQLFYGDECNVPEVLDAYHTHPFLAERRVVVIKKFDALKALSQQKIVDALSAGKDGALLILLSENLDGKTKVAKKLDEFGYVVQCKAPYRAEEMIPWIKGELETKGKRIDSQALQLFIQRIELDYMTASQELEKLLLYCKDNPQISVKEVQTSTGISRSYTVFDLINSIGERNEKKTLIMLENMLENNEAAIFIITMLLRFFVQLWKINALKDKKIPMQVITDQYMTDVFAYFRKDYIRYAGNYPLRSIPQIFSILLETDSDLKSINLAERVLLERMMFRIFALR